jgi:hypothetical protein
MPPTLTYPELVKLKPCPERRAAVAKMFGGARKWNGNPITAQQARDAGATFFDIVWAASALARTSPDVDRRVRLWLADCAAHVLHVFEQDCRGDHRPRHSIVAARQFARGEIDAAASYPARDAAWAAAWAIADAASYPARDAAWAAAWAASYPVNDACAAAWAASYPARDAEEQWQFDRLIAWLSDPEPQEWPLPETTEAEAA